jgi:hypothetical protein
MYIYCIGIHLGIGIGVDCKYTHIRGGIKIKLEFVLLESSWQGEDLQSNKVCRLAQTERSYRTGFSFTPSGGPAVPLGGSQSLLPLPVVL